MGVVPGYAELPAATLDLKDAQLDDDLAATKVDSSKYTGACHFECSSYGSQVTMNLVGAMYSNDRRGDAACLRVARTACQTRKSDPRNVFTRPAFEGETSGGTTTAR